MKKYHLFLGCLFAGLIIPVVLLAQQKTAFIDKCGIDRYLQSAYKNYPGYKEAMEKGNRMLSTEMQLRLNQSKAAANNQRVNAVTVIPVVFHIVLPNADSVTDAEIQFQLDVLNRDYGGQNADSTNLSPMFPYSLRGHSGLRFCLAQKDIRGNLTNGIERRCSNTMATTAADDPVKRYTTGGLAAWDPTRYFNIWVSNSAINGLLGYATYPFSFSGYNSPDAVYQGVVVTRAGFGNSTALYAANRGRTLVHETGHFFGLFHTFEGGCSSQDFSLTTYPGSSDDDTPPQSNPTGYGNPSTVSCPSGKVQTGCSAGIDSGRLYQNFMDYTDDPCLTMFTVNQVLRMEAAVDLFRSTLKSSDACTPPPLVSNNISLTAMLHPFGGQGGFFPGCSVAEVSNVYCTSSLPYTISPAVRVRNAGSNAVGELDIWYAIDNNIPVLNSKYFFAAGLEVAADTLLSINPILLNAGTHTLKVFTKNPNRAPDRKPENDTVTATVLVDLPTPVPVVEGFEGPLFPPAGWRLISSSGDNLTWERTLLAKNSGQAAAFVNFYNYDLPGKDNLLSPAIDIRNADSILVSFYRAYKQYSLTPDNYIDSLELVISEDCGTTFKTIWKKGGAQLASNPGPTGFVDWYPVPTDWVPTTLDVKPFVSAGALSVHIGFRAKNGFGQNLFLDDINIKAFIKPKRDASIKEITEPFDRLCARTFTPSFVIANTGKDTITSLTVNYSIDGGSINKQVWMGTLPAGQSTTVSLAVVTLSRPGIHNLLVYSSDPNNSADQNTLNDSLSVRFNVFDPVPAPVNEGFESIAFAPDNWYVKPSNNSYSWDRTTNTSSEGLASAWMRNRRYNGNGAADDLYSPLIQIQNADSVFAKFDLAYSAVKYPTGSNIPTDTLEVLFTKDCGRSFTSVYKKWGEALQTTTSTAYAAGDTTGFMPVSRTQWRMDSINLTAIAGAVGTFQLAFRNINNNGNNIFIDNIRINQVTLPAKLKREGYLVIPNPSRGLFIVQHYLRPVNLKAVQVFNTGGQLVWEKRYSGDAQSSIPVNLSQVLDGVYVIRLLYTDRVITQRIIKIN